MTDYAKSIFNRTIIECELPPDSKDWKDYEKAKKYIYDNYPNIEYFRYHKAIKLITEYLGV